MIENVLGNEEGSSAVMLTRKAILAKLIAEYGSIENAMFNSDNDGICLNCGFIQSGVEPDASGYRCENCGEATVDGVENTIISRL